MKKLTTSPLLTSIVVSSRYLSVWIAILLLILACYWIAPSTLTRTSFTTVLPLTSFLALAALGQMLVVMTGGIDLSIPGVMTLAALVTVGISGNLDERLPVAIATALGVSLLLGLISGTLVGVLKLNPLIVTLAMGQIIYGAALAYADNVPNEASVPPGFAEWITAPFLGLNNVVWMVVIISIVLVLIFRYTEFGRKFQSVGANPHAAWILGLRVNGYVILAYMTAYLLYGLNGIVLAGFLRSPSLVLGAPYLLGPIAAVVIAGASLTGGLANAISTWGAAFFLVLLNQMLRVLGLPTALQFTVFGIAIIGGMVISGDRIVTLIENSLIGISRFKKNNAEDEKGGVQAT
ncbi:MAG TPA: ABC transporter permease [Anaerolineae bacterium]|nr:ABC transporter permease [Anaerolineae bacterium]